MLRESSQIAGHKIQLSDITAGLTEETQIPHGDLLISLAEAIVARDTGAIGDFRDRLFQALGNDPVVDAVAVASGFHGFVRIADAIGIPYTTAAQGQDIPEIRQEVGINEFFRIKGSASVP